MLWALASAAAFLGLLHMEIIQERLEREYNLDLITTAPNVVYRITKTDGSVVMVDNPLNYPDPAEIELAEEPYVKASHHAPPRNMWVTSWTCVPAPAGRVQRYGVSGQHPGGAAL